MNDTYFYFWIILIIAFLITEIITSISLVTIWFIPGAIVSSILCHFNCSIQIQIIVFIIISFICLLLTKPISKKIKSNENHHLNLNAIIGLKLPLIKGIENDSFGEVCINGVIWNAKSLYEQNILKNKIVKIIAIEGNVLIVKEQKGES